MPRRRLAAAGLVCVLLAACGDDSSEESTPTTQTPTGAASSEPLAIVVTNDDGIGGAGIDVLVRALETLPDVEVTIVAPATDQSGTSDTATSGAVAYDEATTVSGRPGTAVEGYPADTITVALDELRLDPDLVVSGINRGQNIGPIVLISGTIGAARTAIRRGVPAVAASAGPDNATADYDGAAALVLDWITEHRDELVAGTAPAAAVVSFNVPTCTAGEPRELLEVPVAATIPDGLDVFAVDCSVVPETPPTDDVTAIAAGHATVSDVPADL